MDTGVAKAEKIGRFRINRTLGEGAQGKVYLATDTRLGRQIALKTLLLSDSANAEAEVAQLFEEARTISRFQHPNIVSLYEADIEDQTPYLVLEYIEGETLADLIKKQGKLSPESAMTIAMQILQGLDYAHQQDIIHSDLKPGNVLLTRDNEAKVVDFGIARHVHAQGDDGLSGTPQYMAPELLENRPLSQSADIFSMGLLLHEMLTGKPLIDGSSTEAAYKDLREKKFQAPSNCGAAAGADKLDALVLKALNRDTAARFQDAREMLQALEEISGTASSSKSGRGEGEATIEFLIRRMQRHPDFPALSGRFTNLNKLFESDTQNAQGISAVILKDVALTNKMLRVVNSAFYARLGGSVSTISRAVVMLGLRAVRDLAASLILFDTIKDKEQAQGLKDKMIEALFAASVARKTGEICGEKETEEIFLCGMFHVLGELAVRFYLNDELQEIQKLTKEGLDEDQATRKVLGTNYQKIGMAVAREWNFPQAFIDSMQHFKPGKVKGTMGRTEKLQAHASLATDVCRTVKRTDPRNLGKDIGRLGNRYGESIRINKEKLITAVKDSQEEFVAFSKIMGLDIARSELNERLNQWQGKGKPLKEKDKEILVSITGEEAVDSQELQDKIAGRQDEDDKPMGDERIRMLNQGVQDITQTLLTDFQLDDILNMILETLYRALGFDNVLLCLKDGRSGMVKTRLALGKDSEQMRKSFAFSVKYSPDVFHLAMEKGVDISINDVKEEKIASRIPDWYKDAFDSSSFVLFPMKIGERSIGMIYADQKQGGQHNAILEDELGLMKTLRNQALLAVRTKAG